MYSWMRRDVMRAPIKTSLFVTDCRTDCESRMGAALLLLRLYSARQHTEQAKHSAHIEVVRCAEVSLNVWTLP